MDQCVDLEEAAAKHGVTGASFAYWDGRRTQVTVTGVRNSITADPVTPDTLMHIGSITKVLNTTLLMQLVDEGKVDLDDLVEKYLPDLRLADHSALGQITCRMLLNHTSGIDCDLMPDHGPDQERIVDAIRRLGRVGQVHPPGAGPSYCNSAMVIAGYLVQELRGESWYSVVKGRLFTPLEMEHSVADLVELPRFRHAVGDLTFPRKGLLQTTRPFLPLSFAPAGTTLMLSASDVVTFARALLNNGVGANGYRILSAAAVEAMRTPTVGTGLPTESYWGLGWMILPGDVLHHAGAGPGTHSVLYAHAPSGRVFALLTNCDRGDLLRLPIVEPILESWTGRKSTRGERVPLRMAPSFYEGCYENSLYRAEIEQHNGNLRLRLSFKFDLYDNTSDRPDHAVPLHPLADDTFEVASALPGCQTEELRFVRNGPTDRAAAVRYAWRLLPRTH